VKRKSLPSMWIAGKLYGFEYQERPRYAPEGVCEWCGGKLSKRQTSCCSPDCRREFNNAVTWQRGRGAYSTHLLRRDNFTCSNCGENNAYVNGHGMRIPVSNGRCEVHHIKPVSEGGSDAPENLTTLCTDCHLAVHGKAPRT
jgi:5-methylcytosine-specific restriction endonuclease McrA